MNNDQFEQLLQESLENHEKIPEHLTEKIRAQVSPKKHGMSFLLRLGTACAALMVVFTAAVNSHQTVANAMYQVPVIGELARVLTFRVYEDTDHYFSAYLQIPEAEGLGEATDALNRAIDEYINGFVELYELSKEEAGTETIEGETAHFNLTNQYRVVTNNDRWFSIEISTGLVMASGTEYQKHFTVDKQAEKIISLADLFADGYDYRGELYRAIRAQMKEQMEADENIMYFEGEWGLSEITGNENFYITEDDELVITFDEYEVAPGSMGVCSFNLGKLENGKLAD